MHEIFHHTMRHHDVISQFTRTCQYLTTYKVSTWSHHYIKSYTTSKKFTFNATSRDPRWCHWFKTSYIWCLPDNQQVCKLWSDYIKLLNYKALTFLTRLRPEAEVTFKMLSRDRWWCHHDIIVLESSLHQNLSSMKVSLQLLFGNYAKGRLQEPRFISMAFFTDNLKKKLNKNKSWFAALHYETANNQIKNMCINWVGF